MRLVAFAAAFALSALVDNSVLATVGGFAAGFGPVMLAAVILFALGRVRGDTGMIRQDEVERTLSVAVPLASTVFLLALSWIAFLLRRPG